MLHDGGGKDVHLNVEMNNLLSQLLDGSGVVGVDVVQVDSIEV